MAENITKYSHHERFRSYQTSQFPLISYELIKSGKWLTFRENIYMICIRVSISLQSHYADIYWCMSKVYDGPTWILTWCRAHGVAQVDFGKPAPLW